MAAVLGNTDDVTFLLTRIGGERGGVVLVVHFLPKMEA
jgi:hypothetical protein